MNETKRKVQVWIYTQSPLRVLLFKTTPQRGGFWQPVTGSVEPEEILRDAALREATEESGLKFNSQPEFLGFEFEFESRGAQFKESVFIIEAPSDKQISLDPREHVEWRWEKPEDAQTLLKFKSNSEALQLLVERIFLQGH